VVVMDLWFLAFLKSEGLDRGGLRGKGVSRICRK
jgi:hypothetical protein